MTSILNAQITKLSPNEKSFKTLENKYSNPQIELFIREVFLEHANELVFENNDSGRLALITDFLNHRFDIQYKPQFSGKKFDLLSTVELSNKYNPKLQRDYNLVSKNVFNPLKYNFPMHSRDRKTYRIDNTDYIITILPIK
jgi:hypothetical protein